MTTQRIVNIILVQRALIVILINRGMLSEEMANQLLSLITLTKEELNDEHL